MAHQTLMQKDKVFCEIIAKDRKDPLNNQFTAYTTQDEWGKTWNKDVLYYEIITTTPDIKKRNDQITMVNLMMTMWDIEIDLDLHPISAAPPGVKADIRIFFKSSDLEPYFKERPSTLAFAYYPGQGDVSGIMVFNDDYYFNLTGKGVNGHIAYPEDYPKETNVIIKGYNVIAIGGHEGGHMLGLTHSTRGFGIDLMDPYYNPDQFVPSMYDIIRIIVIYPREQYKRWRSVGILRRWVRLRILRFRVR